MASFTEIRDEVYALTKRSDLVAQTESAIRMATLRAHHLDFWSRDLREEVVDFTTPAFTVTWSYKVAYPRFRSVNYIVKAQHPSNEPYGSPLENITPLSGYDDYQLQKQNVWYIAGTSMRLSFSEQVRKILIGFYQHPDIVAPAYVSWIADDYPWVIIQRAAERVLSSIGFEDLARYAAAEAAAQEALLKIGNVQDVGY